MLPLQEFHACFNFFTCVPDHFFLPAANSLMHLFLCCNNLTTIPALNTPLLTELGLACNKITKMEHLDHLPHLARLDLRANRISRLEGLSANTQLCRFGAACMWRHEIDVSMSLVPCVKLKVMSAYHYSIAMCVSLAQFVSVRQPH